MFIKIKAQSSDLEKEYIRERDIFKKKRKGPKLFLAGFLITVISGYFYYLNQGDSLQTFQKAITMSEPAAPEQSNTTPTSHEPQLITGAIASDEPITTQTPDIPITDSSPANNGHAVNQPADIITEEKLENTPQPEIDTSESLTMTDPNKVDSNFAVEILEVGLANNSDQESIEQQLNTEIAVDSDTPNYQGSSVEEISELNYQSINIESPDVNEISAVDTDKNDALETTKLLEQTTDQAPVPDNIDNVVADNTPQANDFNPEQPEAAEVTKVEPVSTATGEDHQADESEVEQTQVAEAKSATQKQTTINVEQTKIDPNKSLALVEHSSIDAKLNPVEELVINNDNDIEQTSTIQNTEQTSTTRQSSQSIQSPIDNRGNTALMVAALNADNQTARELIQQGARVNARNNWGWTALLNATIKGNRPLVEYLLGHGASPHLADNDGRSPLMAAVLNDHPEIVKILLSYNADVNKANQDGWTALSFAAWKGSTTSVKYLLEANAFKHHQTPEGLTPLQLARQGNHSEVINLLD